MYTFLLNEQKLGITMLLFDLGVWLKPNDFDIDAKMMQNQTEKTCSLRLVSLCFVLTLRFF